jgi:uncharacterized Zn finger protein (UPF0148 family)
MIKIMAMIGVLVVGVLTIGGLMFLGACWFFRSCKGNKASLHEKRVLCPVCAVADKWTAYGLIYRIRGEYVCENCGDRFVVTFSEGEEGNYEMRERHEKGE